MHQPNPMGLPGETPAQSAARLGLTETAYLEHVSKIQDNSAATALPCPGPLAAAFPPRLRRVGALTIRPIVIYDFCLLQAIDSPILQQMAEAAKPAELQQPVKPTIADKLALVYLFTHPIETSEAHIAKSPAHYHAIVKTTLGHWNPGIALAAMNAVDEMIAESADTALKYISGETPSEDSSSPSAPPPPTATASAGGSITPAV